MINKATDFSKAKDSYGLIDVIGTYEPKKPAWIGPQIQFTKKRMRQPLCDSHKQPVCMFSYICMKFWCSDCYEESFEKADVYAMNELNLPVERMYGSLIKYIDGGLIPKLESYHMDYKEVFENFIEDRKKYTCLLYTSPSPRDQRGSRMPSSA